MTTDARRSEMSVPATTLGLRLARTDGSPERDVVKSRLVSPHPRTHTERVGVFGPVEFLAFTWVP